MRPIAKNFNNTMKMKTIIIHSNIFVNIIKIKQQNYIKRKEKKGNINEKKNYFLSLFLLYID